MATPTVNGGPLVPTWLAASRLTVTTAPDAAARFLFWDQAGAKWGAVEASVLSAAISATGGGGGGGAGISAGTQSVSTGTVVFSNSNGITFGMSGSSRITASYTVPSTAGLISAVNVSAGTTSNNLSALTFSNGSGVSFGLNGSVVTATVQTNYLTTAMLSNAATISNVNVSAGTTSNNLSALVFSNSNGVSFGLNGSTVTASAGGGGSLNVSAGTTSNNLTNVVFSNSNGINFGLNGSTVTASNVRISMYENCGPLASNVVAVAGGFGSAVGATSSVGVGFVIPQPLSVGYARFIGPMSTWAHTFTATLQTIDAHYGISQTYNLVLYSLGTGGSSRSLYSVASGSESWAQKIVVSCTDAAAMNSVTYAQYLTAFAEGASMSSSYSTKMDGTSGTFQTSAFSDYYGAAMYLDVRLNTSLSPGFYWGLVGMSRSDSSISGVLGSLNHHIMFSGVYGQRQANLAFGVIGNTNRTSGGALFAGVFTTAGGGTTSALPLSAISTTNLNHRLYFQLINQA